MMTEIRTTGGGPLLWRKAGQDGGVVVGGTVLVVPEKVVRGAFWEQVTSEQRPGGK